jgi:lipopolysaccharide export system permease protein
MILSGLLAIIYIFDTLELLRRADKRDNIPLTTILEMSAYKLPEVGQQLLPFSLLFAAILTLWQLTRRHELVILRSAGLSAWRFLSPLFFVSFFIGVFYITVLHPFTAALISQYETMQSMHLGRKEAQVTISQNGLWLKEKDSEGEIIFYAKGVKLPEWQLHNVMALFFNNKGLNIQRLDAKTAELIDNEWVFEGALINRPGAQAQEPQRYTMSTEMTIPDIRESFADPDTISFWALPSFIRTLENTGLEATSMRLYYQNLLSQPLLFLSMILIAAVVSLRIPRTGSNIWLLLSGIATGFAIFFLSNFLKALGATHQLPIALAAWSPSLICVFLGLGILMRTEDG